MQIKEIIEKNILFDSHCHLNVDKYNSDRDEIVSRSIESGIEYIVDISVDYESSVKSIENSKKYQSVLACVGVDPECCVPGSDLYNPDFEDILNQFEKCNELLLFQEKNNSYGKIFIIGETGIDKYWNRMNELELNKISESIDHQTELFIKHIELSIQTGLPISIHSRDAIEESLKVLSVYPNVNAIFHSLTPDSGDDEQKFYMKVGQILERGYRIGLNGIITFKNAQILRNVVLKVIKEKSGQINDIADIYKAGFIFETDGPFLAPLDKRGERNEPAYIKMMVDYLIGN